MDMGAAARAFKKAANKDFVPYKNQAADRTEPVSASLETIKTAPDVHEPVFASVQ